MRGRHGRPGLLVMLAMVAGSALACAGSDPAEGPAGSVRARAPDTTSGSEVASGEWLVAEIVDGDTIVVRGADGVDESVRLVGINAGERGECFAAEAEQRMAELVEGRSVELVADRPDRDQYGRLLRYVMVDGRDVGEQLVREGYAIVRGHASDLARAGRLEAASTEAQAAGRGLWAVDACGEPVEADLVLTEIHSDAPGDDGQNTNGEWIVLTNVGSETLDLGGWGMKDESASHRYRFPDGFSLAPGVSVTVFSGCGADDDDRLFWCSEGSAVWNNAGDTVFVLDPVGNIAVSERYRE